MKTKKKWMTTMMAGGLALVVTACGSGDANNGGQSSANANNAPAPVEAAKVVESTEPITIQYWHSHAEAQMEGLNYMLEEFSKKYPHITVEPVFQGGYPDLHKKLQAAVAANDVPAVTNVEVSSLPTFGDSGVFTDLTPWILRDNTAMDDFSEGMINAYAFNGKQYGFPLIVSTSVFVYNKTLLDELGVQPPQTWDDIDAFNEAVTLKENGETTRYAFSVPGWDAWYFDPWMINGGGQILTDDQSASAVETPESMRYIENFYKWKTDGYMHIGYGKGASDNMRQMFLGGEIAMVQHTSANIKMYRENADFEIGVSFVPGDVKRISNIGGAGIAMMDGASDEEKEAAWKFIEHMTSAEHNIKWAESVGYLPTRKSAIDSEEGKQYFERWPQYEAVFEHFDDVTPRLQHIAYPEFRTHYIEVIGELALNNVDPAMLMPQAAERINEILADYE
ncbi:ABC transporter substrate-binding protein [Paenibacillus camelliae]|uniref:ABC transporter substrate-binding protein n=1 Tax=Paenibacillus camelliae TaxID=512410 RepID=UPI0020426D1C|nr:ABC transporter substrate-binding protein [Paenibacillus camelliae]MCM3634691.1 ABC transporter substrate-binding protein [Paenibacillus camelliae]